MNRLFLFFLFSSLLSFAQEDPTDNKFKIGFEAGTTINYLDRFGPYGADMMYFDKSVLIGTHATFTFSYKIAPFIELQAGTGYARLGGTYRHEAGTVVNQPSAGTGNKQTTSKVYFKDKYKMDFLEIPVLAKFFILPKRTISPFILAGGSYGFLLRSVNSYNFDDISVMTNDDMKNVSQNYFWNYCFGAGIDFYRDENVSFGLSAKMSKSLSKVFKYDKLEYAYPDPENADYEYVDVYNMNTYFHSVALSAYVTRSF